MSPTVRETPEAHERDRPKAAPLWTGDWRRAALLFALASLALLAASFETLSAMVTVWSRSQTYGYGFLILPIVLYLIFQQRHQLAGLTPRPCYWAVGWMVGCLLVQAVGTAAGIMTLKQLALVGLWQGLFALVFGWAVTRQLLFALFYLFFAVPMGSQVVPSLQLITAELTAPLLRASGIPTFLDGVFIEIPTGRFVVAEVCSGARFLITSIVLGTLAARLFFRSWLRRGVFLLLCIVVPILANALRAYGIVMLAHLSDYRLAVSVDHIVYGFIFLSFVLLLLTGLGALFRDSWPGDESGAAGRSGGPAAGVGLRASLTAALLGVALIAGGKLWEREMTRPPALSADLQLTPPRPGDPWRMAAEPQAVWRPIFPGADSTLLQDYRAPAGPVSLFIAHYRYQRDGHEAISDLNSLASQGENSHLTRQSVAEVTLPDGPRALRESVVKVGNRPFLIWSWYDIGGSTTPSKLMGKALQIWHTLRGGSRAATVVALATPFVDDARPARRSLKGFLAALESGDGALLQLAGGDSLKASKELKTQGDKTP